jgi:hypothetical protein
VRAEGDEVRFTSTTSFELVRGAIALLDVHHWPVVAALSVSAPSLSLFAPESLRSKKPFLRRRTAGTAPFNAEAYSDEQRKASDEVRPHPEAMPSSFLNRPFSLFFLIEAPVCHPRHTEAVARPACCMLH